MHTTSARFAVPLSLVLAAHAAANAGCACGVAADTVNNSENVEGDASSTTTVDDVAVENVSVDADTPVEVENSASADVDAEANANIDVTIVFGGDESNESDESDGEAPEGVTSAAGDGVAFELAYQGPIDERVDLVPSVDASLAVASLEWLVRGPVIDEPTIFDDADGFAWGAPQYDDADDALDEYALAVRFGAEALAPLSWSPASTFCDGTSTTGTCVGRAVSAACTATVVMRVWLDDGTARELSAPHESARPACW